MSETLAKVLVGAFFIVITTSLFIYQEGLHKKWDEFPIPALKSTNTIV